jgi:hypothetical protein
MSCTSVPNRLVLAFLCIDKGEKGRASKMVGGHSFSAPVVNGGYADLHLFPSFCFDVLIHASDSQSRSLE